MENAYQVIQDVKAKIAQIGAGLPPGVTVEPFYDRSDLIDRAIATLKHTLWEAVILVTLMHVIFMFHFRSMLIVTRRLTASILIAFFLMKEFGIQSHIMSLTGIAIAIGVLVDAAIVMVENVIRPFASWPKRRALARLEPRPPGRCLPRRGRRSSNLSDSRAAETWQVTLCRPRNRSVGRSFSRWRSSFSPSCPSSRSPAQSRENFFIRSPGPKTFAMVGATVLAVTLVPVVVAPCSCAARSTPKIATGSCAPCSRSTIPVLDWALSHRKTVLGLAATLLAFCSVVAFGLPQATPIAFPSPADCRPAPDRLRLRIHADPAGGIIALHARAAAEHVHD